MTNDKHTNAEPIRCKNPGDDGERMEAAAVTGQSSVAAASTNDKQKAKDSAEGLRTPNEIIKAELKVRSEIKAMWLRHGGSQYGPHVEHYDISEATFWRFIDELRAYLATQPEQPALAAVEPVGVKPLEWDEGDAKTQFGMRYSIMRDSEGTYAAVGFGSFVGDKHADKAAARAACQADYERRISSALYTLPKSGEADGALEPFALLAGVIVDGDKDDATVIGVTVADLRRARAALRQSKERG